jgi:hypothetical protein
VGELCRGKFGRDNGRATLSTLRTDHKERSAWGISRIYDNVRAADLQGAKRKIMPCFDADVYYKMKQLRRAITEEEQRDVCPPKWATTNLPSNSTTMKNSIPH